ncbi:TetR/AcrR family transcriptional regulator [Aestuariibacter sp. A3R04]|uniref:TetR/AcrR family transcriptional regulator n=1 Tax=Aestuariibacter sp. A3R04 TaxID=2841571 RepID=UPI001C08573E|nr:TetR/AcrR family transcriptional regulator [Aestuariibacter sp. A3R04]MBU3021313.1 TetR/AcrR family transcriptional regulator [Aestuariibacter sp. A3R04]
MTKIVSASQDDLFPPPQLSPKAQIVLNAAKKIFLAYGFSAATTDMIQQEAGVSKSTVYAHFANKEALFSAVVQSECASSSNSLKSIQFMPGKVKQMLSEIATAYLDIVLSKSGVALSRIVIAEALRFPQLGEIFYNAGPRACIALATQLLKLAQANNDINLRGNSPEEAARFFVASVRSEPQLLTLTHSTKTISKGQRQAWIAMVVDNFTEAYRPDK